MPGVVATVVVGLILTVAAAAAAATTARRRRHQSGPERRPLEDIAADVRRISVRFHQDGMRFAQYEGRRRSYDRVLAEAADTLEISHLIRVLSPGAELDHERQRLEHALAEAGVLPRSA